MGIYFWAHIVKSAKRGWETAAAKIMPVGGERQWLRQPHPATSPPAGSLLGSGQRQGGKPGKEGVAAFLPFREPNTLGRDRG